MKIRLVEYGKVYVLPETQNKPNIPMVRAKIFVADYNTELEIDVAWSDNVATRKASVVSAAKTALHSLYDEIKGEYNYDPATGTLTKMTVT